VTPDAAGSALHEQRLARRQSGAVEDVAPHGEEGLGQRGRLEFREALGDRQTLSGGSDAELGIAAPVHQGTDPIANREAGIARITANDRAGDFEAGQIGSVLWNGVEAEPLQDVRAVHTCRRHANDDLARLGRRVRALARDKDLGASRVDDFNGAHACSFLADGIEDVGRQIRWTTWKTYPAPADDGQDRYRYRANGCDPDRGPSAGAEPTNRGFSC
jgi:hypothetical protein